MAKYWLFRLATIVVPRVPRWIAQPLAVLVAVIAWSLAGDLRRRAEANLRRVPLLAGHPARIRRAARGVFIHNALNYLDFFRGLRVSEAELTNRWIIEGIETFHQTMAEGKGLVLLTGHFGNWEYGVSRLGLEGYQIVAPAERLRPEVLFELFCRTREHHGLHLYPADSRDTLRQLVDSLKRNEITAFLADRYVIGSSIEVPLFGELAKLPSAPISLALRSGAPAMAIFCWRDPGGWNHGLFVPLTLTPTTERKDETTGGTRVPSTAVRARSGEAVAVAMNVFIRALEQQIMAHPEQWVSALAKVWE